MRIVLSTLALFVCLFAVGCSGDGTVELTPEQLEEMEQNRQEVVNELAKDYQ